MTYFGPKGAAIIGVPVLVRRGSWNDQRSSSGGFFSGLAGSLGRLAGGGSGGISSWGAAFTSTGTGALAPARYAVLVPAASVGPYTLNRHTRPSAILRQAAHAAGFTRSIPTFTARRSGGNCSAPAVKADTDRKSTR